MKEDTVETFQLPDLGFLLNMAFQLREGHGTSERQHISDYLSQITGSNPHCAERKHCSKALCLCLQRSCSSGVG